MGFLTCGSTFGTVGLAEDVEMVEELKKLLAFAFYMHIFYVLFS
jgi:hypothetical protein